MIKAFDKYSNFSDDSKAKQELPVAEVVQNAGNEEDAKLQHIGDNQDTVSDHVSGQMNNSSASEFECESELRYVPDYKNFNQIMAQHDEYRKKRTRKKLLKRVHGIKVIKPAKLNGLNTNPKIIGYISYKKRHQPEQKIGTLKIGITNWDVVSTQDEMSVLIGYIPVESGNVVGIYEIFDLYDKIFPIVFTIVLVSALYLCYVSGGGVSALR